MEEVGLLMCLSGQRVQGGGGAKFCWVVQLWWLEARGKGHHTSHSIIVLHACSVAAQVVMVVFYLLNIIWGSRFKLQV